jgi:hypothetical protein
LSSLEKDNADCSSSDRKITGGDDMAFKTALIAHAPDADPEKHKCTIETEKYSMSVNIVRDQGQALEVARRLAGEGTHSIMLCPGFSHADVAELAEVVGDRVGVFVARGDTPSNRVAAEVIMREWG